MASQAQFSTQRLKSIVRLVVFGQLLMFVSILADVTQIITSEWFKRLLSFDAFRWLSYALNLILTIALIYTLKKALHQEADLKAEIEGGRQRLSAIVGRDFNLWKRFIRILRSITLEDLPFPNQRDALEPLLDELAKRLPHNGSQYKLAIAKPLPDGRFSILAERGMDPSSVFALERWANWKERRSFFAVVLDTPDDIPYALFQRGAANYLDIQRPEGGIESRPSSSGSHFIVVVRDSVYYRAMAKKTLALISIGIPRDQELGKADQELLYNDIYPVVKSIEGVLLCHLLGDGRRSSIQSNASE